MRITELTKATQDMAHKNYNMAFAVWVTTGDNKDQIDVARTLLTAAQDAHWKALEEEADAAYAAQVA